MNTDECLEVIGPYPLAWDRLTIVTGVRNPPLRVAEPAIDVEFPRAWQRFVTRAQEHADLLERLIRAGWTLSDARPWIIARHETDSVEHAVELVSAMSGYFERGRPVEAHVGGPCTAVCAGGGLLVGCPEDPAVWPPRTLPAIVSVDPAPIEYLVEDETELRAAIALGLEHVADQLDAAAADGCGPAAGGLARAARALLGDVRAGGKLPCAVRANVGKPAGGSPAQEACYRLDVTPLTAALWSGPTQDMEVTSLMHPFVSTGQRGRLRDRGSELANNAFAVGLLRDHESDAAVERLMRGLPG